MARHNSATIALWHRSNLMLALLLAILAAVLFIADTSVLTTDKSLTTLQLPAWQDNAGRYGITQANFTTLQ